MVVPVSDPSLDDTEEVEEPASSKGSGKLIVIAGISVLVIAVGAGFVYKKYQNKRNQSNYDEN